MIISHMFAHGSAFWLALGFLGQFLFFMRFFVQWLASERAKKTVVPVAFWYFSVAGGGILFLYALAKWDPVFIMGQGAGLLIYVRNLMLIRAHKKTELKDPADSDDVYFI